MQNRDYTYTFANITGRNEEQLLVYGLTNRGIQRIYPEHWMNDFKSIFDNFGGALVIILKNDSYAQLNQILDMYGKWALMNIPKGVDLKATTLEWVTNSKYNQDNSEKNYTFRTLIKGQLIIVSGLFPDIYIDLHAEFGWEAVDTNKICSYMQIAILQFLLRRIYSSFSCIQDDIDEMLERIGNTVPLRIAYLNDYFRSRRSDLSRLLSIVLYAGK